MSSDKPSEINLETQTDTLDSLKECIQHRTDREVICGDSIEWLNGYPDGGLPAGYCGFTSLPDLSEVQNIFQTDTVSYKKWFTDTVALFMRKLSRGSYVVFLQSDIRYMTESGEVTQWIDKSFLCSTAAEREGCTLMWHKLVYTDKANSKRSTGRPSYSHLLCYAKPKLSTDPIDGAHERLLSKTQARKERSRQNRVKPTAEVKENEDTNPDDATTSPSEPEPTQAPTVPRIVQANYRTSLFAVPDIFFRGHMLWPKGIGLDSCFVGIMFLKDVANATGIIDPFAGQGTVLAMANSVGLPSIGVEISPKRCRKANNLEIDLDLISPCMRKIALDIVAARAELAESGVVGGGKKMSKNAQHTDNAEDEEVNELVAKLSKQTVHVPRVKAALASDSSPVDDKIV
eukprot:CAMPEP_0184968502 /NCGR_PEP_ID=MMETSP1098-20130426/1552_1 /TAXON_ID=89044 /ORGANISM="Spumella elongata, Strain CCAP 955/1" /LENGTH=401 /DNA_ID=CAMNT_0027490131 /DNA_START=122 /DNA_END=1327 /DNA_ORIENTATION=+